MDLLGEAYLSSNAYYPRTPDYILYSGVHVCCSEHSDSSFVYELMSLDYGLGTMAGTTLALRLPRLGKRELILGLFVRLFDLCFFGFAVSSSSWCLGRAAVCDCGTPWTFLLPFFPTLYWLPKLHKRPYKTRFIAYSSSCTTTVLSKQLTMPYCC